MRLIYINICVLHIAGVGGASVRVIVGTAAWVCCVGVWPVGGVRPGTAPLRARPCGGGLLTRALDPFNNMFTARFRSWESGGRETPCTWAGRDRNTCNG